MYRQQINNLKKWKQSMKRKPLVFLGARQVGKTYLLRKFGKTAYKQLAYVNFEHPNAPKNLFEVDFDADRIMTVLNSTVVHSLDKSFTFLVVLRLLYKSDFVCRYAVFFYELAFNFGVDIPFVRLIRSQI